MKGQPITISNIEKKKVKEGFNDFTDKINTIDPKKKNRFDSRRNNY